MKLYLTKQLNGSLIPTFDSDYEKLKKIAPGDSVECTVKRPRNVQFHRKFFALINMVYQNQPEDKTIENFDYLRKYLTKRSGHYEAIETPTGTIYEAKSISFASMDDYEFSKLYSDMIDTIVKIYKWEKSDILENVQDFM